MTIENKSILSIKSFVRKRAPFLLSYTGRLYAQTLGFKDERNYLKNGITGGIDSPSLILLSSNRCATQFIESVLAKIYASKGGQYIGLNRYLFFADKDAKSHLLDPHYMSGLMTDKGAFFGQQGPFEDHECFDAFQMINIIRDPRDLLVSNFHSISSAHVPKDKEFVDRIKRVQEMGLQKFALDDEFIEPIESAMKQALRLQERDNVLFYRYEDMMDDFESFATSCQKFIVGAADEKMTKGLMEMHRGPASEPTEATGRHRRSGRWGQFLKALDADVQEVLNKRFEPYLAAFGYEGMER